MNACDLELIEPTEALREAHMDFLDDFRQAGEQYSREARHDFAAYVRRRRDQANGIGLPDGWVPATTYWLVRGGRVLGSCGLRHRLTDALRDFGGHVGYSIRPSERRKGYATQMLAMVLEKARAMGLKRVLITCDANNVPSARVIQKNGGRLDSESMSQQAGRITQRYWIEL